MGQAASKNPDHSGVRGRREVMDQTSETIVSDSLSPVLALGGGCFWGMEKFVTRNFQTRHPNSIKEHSVGFMNPSNDPINSRPSYKEVCSGRTGYVEVLRVELTDRIHFENLIRFFFGIHDPTTKNRQGADRGSQYASFIFCSDREQVKIAEKVKKELQDLIDADVVRCFVGRTVHTQIVMMTKFVVAGEKHQEYLLNNPNGYCNHFVRQRGRKPPRIQRQIKLRTPTPFVPFSS